MSEYDVILADPPWYYNENRVRGATNHYPVMGTEDISTLHIPAAERAVLFLWATWPRLPDALSVINAWGFEYKTIAWVWVKAKPSGLGFFTGVGYYTRANSEPCLLATRGGPAEPSDRSIQALIYSPVHEHSRKPDEQYRKIEALYPGRRYLELFARRPRPGWDVFGNQVANSIDIPIGVPHA